MTITEAIRARKSIRKYKEGVEVSQEHIDMLLEAAMLAPSACNSRPWEFIVVKTRDTLNEIAAIHPYAKMLSKASLAIIVCALPESQTGIAKDYFPQDCGAATQNILLQATELGLGSCWCGVYPKQERITEIQQILKITAIPFNVIAIGVADESPNQRGFYEPAKVKYM